MTLVTSAVAGAFAYYSLCCVSVAVSAGPEGGKLIILGLRYYTTYRFSLQAINRAGFGNASTAYYTTSVQRKFKTSAEP